MHGRVEVLPNQSEVAHAAARRFAVLAHAAIDERGRFVAALAGGRAVEAMYRFLATPDLSRGVEWTAVHLFASDERFGSSRDEIGIAARVFAEDVSMPVDQVHHVPADASSEEAAQRYAAAIGTVLGDDPFDLVMLEMGSDGHVAGVFPGSEALYAERRGAVGCWAPGVDTWCVTLTLAEINRSQHVIVLAAGAEKSSVIADLRTGASGVPAARLRPQGPLTWLVDRSASEHGVEDQKRAAAEAAVAEVRSGMVIGLGTGSTVRWVMEAIARELREGRLTGVRGVPTSSDTEIRARALGIPLATLAETPALDLAIDGADEIDPHLDLVKGGGGALLREKIVAHAAREFIVVADAGKLVPRLLDAFPLPVEIIPFGWSLHLTEISQLGGEAVLRLAGGQPFTTDNGHYVLDCRFPGGVDDLHALEACLRQLPGVVATGLFLDTATRAFVAGAGGVRRLERT